MYYIQFAIFGLVAGALARLLHPGRDPMNWLWTMLLGIAGSLLGGWLAANVFNVDPTRGFYAWGSAIGGAIILLALHRALTGRTAATDGYLADRSGPATNEDYKQAVFDDLSRGPR